MFQECLFTSVLTSRCLVISLQLDMGLQVRQGPGGDQGVLGRADGLLQSADAALAGHSDPHSNRDLSRNALG